MNHVESKRPSVRRPRVVLGRAAVAGGLVAAGAAFGVLVSLPSTGPADAGEANYVKSASHEAISNVRLDEEISILFSSNLWAQSVGPDTILVRTGPTAGEQARGSYVVGRFMNDRRSQRRVVIRPEAVQEYYQLIQGLSREDATRQAARLIQRVEKTGRFKLFDKLDRELATFFGASYGAGTRLDDSAVFATYPPPLNTGDPLTPYRERIAGDDVLWQQYIVNSDYNAFAQLQQNSEYERFYHRIDPATGVAEPTSVLRGRKYRRVLVDRRSSNRVMFVPEVPIRADLTDTGFKMGAAYSVVIPAKQPNVYNTVLTQRGRRPLLQSRGRDFSTYFTTIPGSVNSPGLFLDNEARTGLATLQKPRIINQTPPAGETFVDSTTDWEDPDNQGTTPVSARRTFSFRLRFAQPLDPRTVTTANFTVRKTKINPDTPGEVSVDIPVSVGTFLSQSRFGNVEVEITPATNLDPNGKYEVTVKGLVKSLGGELLNLDYRKEITTGSAPPPLDAIRETFLTAGNQADPNNPDTLDQQTTAYWPAPARLDPTGSGRAVAKFMPFIGTGLGAPRDPSNRNSEVVTTLDMQPGEVIQFITEDQDPASPTFTRQLEYNYMSFSSTAATITAIGRYPLIIRSQGNITLTGTNVLVNGAAGGDGLMNADTAAGDPPGGLGGTSGPGGYRGGDGAASALTDANFRVILDGQGRLQFDGAKTAGIDGRPGYRVNGELAGGGRGGFSGDNDFPAYDADGSGGPPTPDDNPAMPERRREAGGGGGHATAGSDGALATGTLERDANGDPGGVGGGVYGDANFSTAPLNSLGVPTLVEGMGGAGGGGGGMEDDAPIDTAGPEDAGGGGGGGGGGGIQLVARGQIVVDSSTIDARGGAGGRTYNANRSSTGQGAPGGCGAGGSIWLQAYEGEVVIQNGARVWANGGDNTNSVGELTTSRSDTPTSPSPIVGKGGLGGDGYVRIEDATGVTGGEITNLTSGGTPLVRGVLSTAQFRPELDGSYPDRDDDTLMVVDDSVIYSRWFNTLLDTPTFVPQPDDPSTPAIEGTLLNEYTNESGGSILIECRSAPNDPTNSGHPNLFQVTPWVAYDQVGTISNRRYIQFRATFSLPLTYTSDKPLPYIDFLQINIELQ